MNITVKTTINAPVENVWEYWTAPDHIIQWSFATDEWYCPFAKNDLRPGGEFISRMEAKDGSMGFDFSGTYDHIERFKNIKYTLDDGREIVITFLFKGDSTHIIETFEDEKENSLEMQQAGWQSILNNFKKYAESLR